MADYQSNMLYQLIRARAGSKMIREAEQVNVYDVVEELCLEENPVEASRIIRQFHQDYPILDKEVLMSSIRIDEVDRIDSKELQELPWIYVYILRALTWTNELAAEGVNEKIKASPAQAWRGPFIEVVDNKEIFDYIYTRWYQQNEVLLNYTTKWAIGVDYQANSAVELARYKRVQAIAAEKIAFMRREMLKAERDDRDDDADMIRGQLEDLKDDI